VNPMSTQRIFVTRKIPEAGLRLVRERPGVDVWEADAPIDRASLLSRVRGISGLLCMLSDPIDRELLDAAGPGLKVISSYAVGLDNIDLAEATRRRIAVGHTPGVLTDATADLAFALLLCAARRLPEGERYVRAGRWRTWSPTLMLGRDVFGATLGIVGFGRIGRAVARRARGFGMKVLFTTRSDPPPGEVQGATRVDLDVLLAESDFVSLHAPLTPQTRHLIDARALARMKPAAILVNAGRGALVDPAALYAALKEGRLAAAALDVTEPEPLPADHPLLGLDNCLVVPHVGSATVQTRERMAVIAAENLFAGLDGKPVPLCANPQIY